jgi:predicted nucleic acid-binding protein
VIVLDTSALLPLIDARDPGHDGAKATLASDPGPYLVPTAILAEVGYLIDHRLGGRVLDVFLADLEVGAFELDCGDDDVGRIRELVARYADLSLGLADAAVIACTERRGGRVMSFDRRDFEVVAREGRITLLP